MIHKGGDFDLLKTTQTSFQRVRVTLITKPTYFHGALKVKVEYGQLAPNAALGYFHIQGLFSLLLSTKGEYHLSMCDP